MNRIDINQLIKSCVDKDLEHILPYLTVRQKQTLLLIALKMDKENTQQETKDNE